MTPSTQKEILFLHYGPGGNSEVEKVWFNDQKKAQRIEFWNQPKITDAAGGYEKLLEACAAKIRESRVRQIWAHSFGCSLALDLINEPTLELEKVTLCSPLSNIPQGFVQLARNLAKDPGTTPALKSDLVKAVVIFDAETKGEPARQAQMMWPVVGVLAQDPAFARLYFHDVNDWQRYLAIAGKVEGLDLAMWQNILSDYLATAAMSGPLTPRSLKAGVEIEILLGEFDPYFEIDAEEKWWQNRYPMARVRRVAGAAHFCHLEKDLF